MTTQKMQHYDSEGLLKVPASDVVLTNETGTLHSLQEDDVFKLVDGLVINFEGDGAFLDSLVIDEGGGTGTVSGTFDEDHLTRRFYEKDIFLKQSVGADSAEQPALLDSSGTLHPSMVRLTFEETDGVPSVSNVVKVRVSTGTLTDEGEGQILLTTGGGGGDSSLSFAILAQQETSGTDGGTLTSGAWRTRDINTIISDIDDIVSIGSSQFTPDSGTYLILWSGVGKGVEQHQTRLYNATGAAEVEVGETVRGARPDSGSHSGEASNGAAIFSPNGTDAYEIQHRSFTTHASEGFGAAGGWGTEQYCTVRLIKIS